MGWFTRPEWRFPKTTSFEISPQEFKMREAVIVAATRTAVGKFGGALAATPAPALGAAVIKSLLERGRIEAAQVDDVILGQVLTGGSGQNPARQSALQAGLPHDIPALTVNMVCGSGLRAVHLAAQAIRSGDAEIVIAGGQENMSAAPHVLPGSRDGQRMGDWKLVDTMIQDGLWCAFNGYHMGCTAENLATKYGISRQEQDAFSAASQQKTEAAQKAGRFDAEITPILLPQKKGDPVSFKADEFPRHGTTVEALAKLKPAFRNDGSVTAGNASGINDGAAAVLVMSAERARALGLEPIARIAGYASAGVDPAIMGIGPVEAVKKTLSRAGWGIGDLELIESNEAFAAQALSVNKALGWNTEIVNVNGGAVALGHPIGASGCRILVTLLHEMQRRGARKGLATLCIGGGQGVAIAVER
jgi:acetyl-CoA C-acetyltransferase